MLFAVDIGNTNIVFGIFADETVRACWRVETKKQKTADEYAILIRSLLAAEKLNPQQINGAIISCVVPPLSRCFELVMQKLFNCKAVVVSPGIKTAMPILYDNPKEVGADRIVNAVAAYHQVKGALIVIDFGTATTFDVVSAKGEYLGGVISPGMVISMDALFFRASKLPRIELAAPRQVIGKNTIESMQSGIVYGYVGLVDGMVHRIWDELGGKVYTMATGGLAELISPYSTTIEKVDPDLTLEGLRLLYRLNRPA
ncbi:MAG: type III pantothenate kinase [Myxococcales bacterium]|nr:type III pantothenate kinase [Myxococcales bacterium]